MVDTNKASRSHGRKVSAHDQLRIVQVRPVCSYLEGLDPVSFQVYPISSVRLLETFS
jgi:hypothetical protein